MLLSLTLGIATGFYLMPTLFAAAPLDLRRTQILLQALHTGPSRPEIVVFGNSIAMCGIDARAIETGLPGSPISWNLSSPGQTLAESFLYLQELPRSVRTIVYVLPIGNLESPAAFNPYVINAFYMYGYRPSKATRELLTAIYKPSEVIPLMQPNLAQRFEARWAVRNSVDTGLRQLLRPDLELQRSLEDLHHPAPYTQRLPSEKLDRELRDLLTTHGRGEFRPAPAQMRLLSNMVTTALRDQRHVVLAFAPIHPTVLEGFGAEFTPALEEFIAGLDHRSGVSVLDATQLLTGDDFIDAVHPTSAGAHRWTVRLVETLAELN